VVQRAAHQNHVWRYDFTISIEPGNPWEDPYIESFSGKSGTNVSTKNTMNLGHTAVSGT